MRKPSAKALCAANDTLWQMALMPSAGCTRSVSALAVPNRRTSPAPIDPKAPKVSIRKGVKRSPRRSQAKPYLSSFLCYGTLLGQVPALAASGETIATSAHRSRPPLQAGISTSAGRSAPSSNKQASSRRGAKWAPRALSNSWSRTVLCLWTS